MTNNHVKTSLMGKHKINKVNVEIYFAPEVIEAFVSNDEISVINNLKAGEEYDLYPLETLPDLFLMKGLYLYIVDQILV